MRILTLKLILAIISISFSGLAYADLSRSQTRAQVAIVDDPTSSSRDRREAISQLAIYTGRGNELAHSTLLRIAQDESFSDSMRSSAISGAANIRGFGSATHEVALALIQGDNSRLANGAGTALQRLMSAGYSRSGQALVEILEHSEDPEIPVNNEDDIIDALKLGGYNAAIPEILERVNSSDRATARAAINSFRYLHGENKAVRDSLFSIIRDSSVDSTLRSNAFMTLSQRATDRSHDLEIVRQLVSDFSAESSTDDYRAEILSYLGWTGLVRVRNRPHETINIRNMIFDNMRSDNVVLQMGALEALERNGNYSDHRGAIDPLIRLLNSSNEMVRNKAVHSAIYYVVDDQWSSLSSAKKKELLGAMAKSLQSSDRYTRTRTAEKIIELLLPYIRRSRQRQELMTSISNCIQFESSIETVTAQDSRGMATGAATIMPVPFLFVAIFGDFEDFDYDRVDVDNIPPFDQEDLSTFQSIIDLIISN